MGLTAEQGDCLVANVGTVDVNDMTALMDLMTQCGISLEQLTEIGSQTATTEPGIAEPATTDASSTPVEIDAASAAAVLALLGLDKTAVDCLVTEAETAAPADDAAAEQVFITCNVGPLQVLDAIVALAAAAGDAGSTGTTVAVAGTETTVANAMVDLLLQQLEAQGITLDATQGQCLLDNISDFDPNDLSAMAAVFETCGINIADLIPES